MNISISVAATPCAMPQIMFAGDLEARCALLAGLGYDGIDMFFPDPQGTDARTAKAALDRNGLRATMLAAQGDLMADGLYLNDAWRLSELLERSKYHLEQCAVLGAMPNIGFIRGWHRNDPGSLPRMADGLAAYCQLAASFGVDVLLEPICRYEIDSIHTTDQAIDLCERAGKPANLGLLLDLFHMNIEEASLCGAICRAGSLVRHVHFVDNTPPLPCRMSLARLETMLAGRPFLRTQRGFLVNLHQVQRLRRYEFILRSGRRVPVSERRYGQVRQEYLEWQARFEEWAARF